MIVFYRYPAWRWSCMSFPYCYVTIHDNHYSRVYIDLLCNKWLFFVLKFFLKRVYVIFRSLTYSCGLVSVVLHRVLTSPQELPGQLCSKVKVKPLFSAHCVVRSISFDPFTWSIPNLVQGLPFRVDDPYWFSVHMFKGQGQTTFLSPVFKVM